MKNRQTPPWPLRWCAAGMIEARGQFRRVNGHLHLPTLRHSAQRSTRMSPTKLSAPSIMMNP